MKSKLLFICCIIFLISCKSNKRENLLNYYFPFDDLHNNKTYKYVVKSNEKTDTLFWKFSSKVFNNEKILTSEGIVNNVRVSKNSEAISKDKSTYIKSYLYENDNAGNIGEICTVINDMKNTVFLFEIRKDESYSLEFKYISPTNNTEITITRFRKFKCFSSIPYKGKIINCAIFQGQESYNTSSSNVVFKTIEYFGEGIGFMKSTKDCSKLHIETILVEII